MAMSRSSESGPYHQKAPLNPPAIVLNDMLYCNNTPKKYAYVYYQLQSVRGTPFEHFDILVISWQFEHFWANNWQGINNSHRTIKLWFNVKIFLFHLIFTTYQNYPLALTLKVPKELQLYGVYVYYVVHICDFGMLRVKVTNVT